MPKVELKRKLIYTAQAELMLAQMPEFNREEFEDWFLNESPHTVLGGGHLLDYFAHLSKPQSIANKK